MNLLCLRSIGVFALTVALVQAGRGAEPPAAPILTRIKAVRHEGAGNEDAAKAWRELVRLGPNVLPDVLAALNDAEPIAANWLRSAVDAIAERAVADKQALPAAALQTFVRQTTNAGAARRLAYEWLVRVDPTTPKRLLPAMLNDPGAELRRDAIAQAYQDAARLPDKDQKAAAFRKLFEAAREPDQVDLLAEELKKLGVVVDITDHYGFISRWLLIGPFDNTRDGDFHKAYPPEQKVDVSAVCKGKGDQDVRWTAHQTNDSRGLVDLNKAIGKHHAVVAYAFAAVDSPQLRPVEIRAGSNNAVKLFLNGKQIYFREEYHHGQRMDQHVGRGTLRAGRNEILIKVCQNDQTDTWAQNWTFQVRVCDALGGAVPLTVLTPSDKGTLPRRRHDESLVSDWLPGVLPCRGGSGRRLAPVPRTQRFRRVGGNRPTGALGAARERSLESRPAWPRCVLSRGSRRPSLCHRMQRSHAGPATRPVFQAGRRPTALGAAILGDRQHHVPSQDRYGSAHAGK
jgi:hypothetical protein